MAMDFSILMDVFMSVPYLAVLVAAIVEFLFGWVWYSAVFGKTWIKIMKLAEDVENVEGRGPSSAMMMLYTFIVLLVQVFLVSFVVVMVGFTDYLFIVKITTSFAFFMILGMVINVLYEKTSWAIFGIHAGYIFINAILLAIVLNFFI